MCTHTITQPPPTHPNGIGCLMGGEAPATAACLHHTYTYQTGLHAEVTIPPTYVQFCDISTLNERGKRAEVAACT